MQILTSDLQNFLDKTLLEDVGKIGDITSNILIEKNQITKFEIVSNQDCIVCGLNIVEYFFHNHSSSNCKNHFADGDFVKAGEIIASGNGNAKEILLLERTVLNYLQHLSGISTTTNEYVQKIKQTKALICDTRKTIPGLRVLQKYATQIGGAKNHRFGLDSGILIKDNHISICGGIKQAIKKAKMHKPHYMNIEIECDTIDQVIEATEEGVDIIMLDNMKPEEIKEAVKIISGKSIIEVSGGININNLYDIALCNVDFISIGRLTHSVNAIDMSMHIFD
jgi:nicotinate-nucleotide pyrophosphorylase (carboxylating)